MTPNLNANPLAALIANATKTSAGTDTPLNPGVTLAGKNGETTDSESPFFNILQIHKGQFSSELKDGVAGNQPPFAAVSLTQDGLTRQGQALTQQGQAPPGTQQGQAQPVSGLAFQIQTANKFSEYEQGLNSDLDQATIDQELIVQPLAVPVPGTFPVNAPLVGDPAAGARSPQGGNSLPLSVQAGHTGQHIGLESEGAELAKSALLARTAPPAPAAVQHPANHPLAEGLAQPVPVPEFMEQLAKFPKTAPGIGVGGASSVLTQGMQGLSDLARSVTDNDATGADMIRAGALATTPERQVALQPAPAVIPLSRLAGAPGWDQGLGQRILWMVDNGLNRAELRLDPPHLGSVNVRISMQDDQAQLLFQAAHPGAREALELALPRLREMFAQQGLELSSADVSDQSESNAGGNTEQESEQLADHSADQLRNSTTGQTADEGSQVDSGRSTGIDSSAGNSLIDEFV